MRALRAPILLLTIGCLGLGCSAFKRFGYEGFGRDEWQQPERVIEELAIEPGMQVADIGAGGGYFTFRLADAVGPTGHVYAVDVDEDMTSYLEERAREEGYENVTVILGEFGDPLLPDDSIQLVFTTNTYHHIENRVDYFRGLHRDLTADGRIAIVELAEGPWLVPSHFTEPETIVEEMREAGYERTQHFDFIEEQSFQIFRRAQDREQGSE
jgi:arsenite methyltransferase